ncbi:MAG: carbon-nitrogen hydrolase family protein [Gammaproteobacteria bacterium]|nr:carbon-nitrogen hydrolase family protein [Gammaproteobacteria bacterium]
MSLVAAIQMASGPKVDANLIEAARLISLAVAKGAKLVALPENFYLMGMKETDKVTIMEEDGNGPIQNFLKEQASKHHVWLVGGTVPIKADAANKVRAACLVYNDQGERVARYDKIHLFDVNLAENNQNETYRESETIEPGDEIVIVETPFCKLGLAICYDLRFPELFRYMAREGAEVIVLPSAFTDITGKAHWETLVRARAIENLAYVIAPCQGGFHANGRQTYGDSMIVDPWGRVQDRLPKGSGVVMAEVDCRKVQATRSSFPALEHRKVFCDLP